MTLVPRSVVKFAGGYDDSLYVNGTLISEGSQDAPIAFTSLLDARRSLAVAMAQWSILARRRPVRLISSINSRSNQPRPAGADVHRHGGWYYSGNTLIRTASRDLTLIQVTVQASNGSGIVAANAVLTVTGSNSLRIGPMRYQRDAFADRDRDGQLLGCD